MNRHLHMFEGTAARFGTPTKDRRVLVLPTTMRARREISASAYPLPLFDRAWGEPGDWGARKFVGWVCAAYATLDDLLHVSGILDLNEFDEAQRAELLEGGEIEIAAEFDQVVTEPAKGLPHPDVTYHTDWRLRGLFIAHSPGSAWHEPTTIKLSTGAYSDLSTWTPSDQGDPK